MEKWLTSGLGQDPVKMSVQPFVMLKSKETLEKMMEDYKDPRVSLKGSHWLNLGNLSTKINKGSKEL